MIPALFVRHPVKPQVSEPVEQHPKKEGNIMKNHSETTPPGPAEDYESDYKIGKDNIQPFGLDIHNPVFVISALVIVGFVAAALANQEGAAVSMGIPFTLVVLAMCWCLYLGLKSEQR